MMINFQDWTYCVVGGVHLKVGYKPVGLNDRGEQEYSCVCKTCDHYLLSLKTSHEALQRFEVPCDCTPQQEPTLNVNLSSKAVV